MSPIEDIKRRVAALDRPQADDSYRARVFDAFVAEAEGADVVVEDEPDMSSFSVRRPQRRTSLFAGRSIAWAAAVLVMIGGATFFAGSDRRSLVETWDLEAIRGGDEAVLLINGRKHRMADVDTWEAALYPGVEIETLGTAELDLRLGDHVIVTATPGTRFLWPVVDEERRATEVRIAQGELRASSAPTFHGRTLSFLSDHARVTMTGTTIAVLRQDDTTCLCVYEGTAKIAGDGGAVQAVVPGRRCVVPDGDVPQPSEAISDMESMKLSMMRDAVDRRFALGQ